MNKSPLRNVKFQVQGYAGISCHSLKCIQTELRMETYNIKMDNFSFLFSPAKLGGLSDRFSSELKLENMLIKWQLKTCQNSLSLDLQLSQLKIRSVNSFKMDQSVFPGIIKHFISSPGHSTCKPHDTLFCLRRALVTSSALTSANAASCQAGQISRTVMRMRLWRGGLCLATASRAELKAEVQKLLQLPGLKEDGLQRQVPSQDSCWALRRGCRELG